MPLVFAIAAWSLFAPLIHTTAGLAPPFAIAMAGVLCGGLLSLAASNTLGWHPVLVAHHVRDRGLAVSVLIMGLGAFFATPLLFVSALQTGPPALTNLVNYLWPIVGVLLVAAREAPARRLETYLAVIFGFGGASVAILVGRAGLGETEGFPTSFVLAAASAAIYGAVSAFSSIDRRRRTPDDHMATLLLGLWLAAALCFISLLVAAVAGADIDIDLKLQRVAAFVIYATLLPLGHIAWLTAVRNAAVPSFAGVFVVPVLSTAFLALLVEGAADRSLLAAFVLVITGIAFSQTGANNMPVGFALVLTYSGSVQVSGVFGRVASSVSLDISIYAQLLAELLALFGAFMLSNSVQRNNTLRARLTALIDGIRHSPRHPADREREMKRLEEYVLSGGRQAEPGRSGHGLSRQWADVDEALSNRVSRYEWFILIMAGGSAVAAFHLHRLAESSIPLVMLRAAGVTLVIGVLFAIRDFDDHRPSTLPGFFARQRRIFGLGETTRAPEVTGPPTFNIVIALVCALSIMSAAVNI